MKEKVQNDFVIYTFVEQKQRESVLAVQKTVDDFR